MGHVDCEGAAAGSDRVDGVRRDHRVRTHGFVIEDGVEIPPIGQAQRRPFSSKYPFAELEVGQSFLVPGPGRSVQSLSVRAGHKLGRKFVTRQTNHGLRVWRTA